MTMRPVDLLDGPVRLTGVAEVERTPAGLVPHRLPARARSQHDDPMLTVVESHACGVCLRFVTDAGCLELDVLLTLVQLGTAAGPQAVFDLVVDGHQITTFATRTGALLSLDPVAGLHGRTPDEPLTVRFADLPPGRKEVELWLPHAAAVTLCELRADGAVTPPADLDRRWVHYGSSISHCIEATNPTGVWPVVAARQAGVELVNLGLAGQCHLDPFVARAIADRPADLISLKLGINIVAGDTMRERVLVPALHGFLDIVRTGHPDVPVVLVSPVICPVLEDTPGSTWPGPDGRVVTCARSPELSVGALTLTRVRALEAAVVEGRRATGDRNLHLVDGLALFGPDDVGDLPDGLHSSPAGYRRIGDRFHQLVFEQGAFARNLNASQPTRAL